MLVLTRRRNETIIIGDNEVRVMVLSIHGGQVKLGISADPDITVHREEIYKKILLAKSENKDSELIEDAV